MERDHGIGGISLLNILTLIFIVLKLTGSIEWSWFFVLLPTIVDVVLFIVYALIYAIIVVRRINKKRRWF